MVGLPLAFPPLRHAAPRGGPRPPFYSESKGPGAPAAVKGRGRGERGTIKQPTRHQPKKTIILRYYPVQRTVILIEQTNLS